MTVEALIKVLPGNAGWDTGRPGGDLGWSAERILAAVEGTGGWTRAGGDRRGTKRWGGIKGWGGVHGGPWGRAPNSGRTVGGLGR